jgi:hypothetical protein
MIFQPAARYPADPRAVFILALSVLSGFTAFALKAGPGTLEALLPRWGVILWGVILVLGSATTLVGMAFQSLNGIITEQIGSIMVGASTLFYSALLINFVGGDAIQNVGIIAGWGIACVIRWWQLQRLLHQTYRKVQKAHFDAAVEDAVEEHIRQGDR